MPIIRFCPECLVERGMARIEENDIYDIKGEKIEILIEKYCCTVCSEVVTGDEEFDRALLKAFNEYRSRHNLLFPHEIKEIRERYGLSQRALARILDWGETTINRYERGALQDAAHDEVLQLIKFPGNMAAILNKNENKLQAKELAKVRKRIEELKEAHPVYNFLIDSFHGIGRKYTGNRMFDLEKLASVVTYFAKNIGCLYKTKLLKLLWYAEFVNFKNTSVSMCGTPFVRIDLGPVPESYELLLTILEQKRFIRRKFIPIGEDMGEIIEVESDHGVGLLTETELKTLDYIRLKLGHKSGTQLVELTHQELAYMKTRHRALIPYAFAEEIKAI